MSKKKSFLIFFLILAIAGVSAVAYKKLKPKKWNVLVLSTCSLSANRLGFYNSDAHNSFNIDEMAKHSFVFENAITDMSWSNVSGFLSRIPADHMAKNGYHAVGRPWTDGEIEWQHIKGEKIPEYYMRIPNFERSTRSVPTRYIDDLKDVKARIQNRANWPFIVEVHNKIIHLPYLKKNYKKFGGYDQFGPEIRDHILDFQKNFEKYPERIPFSFYVVERGERLTEAVIKILKLDGKVAADLRGASVSPTFVGLLNNPNLLETWKKSKFFEMDLKVIKATYDHIIKFYDASIKDLLNLYKDKELQDNTVVIFTGDHGEAFLQHGYMVHGETVYDEMIKFPLFIKFPGQTKGRRINLQFYQQGIAKIVEKIMSGELNEDNFEEFINKYDNHPLIYSRNCANNIKSIRYKNEWKYMVNLKNDQKLLYNLKNDPMETKNVYDDHPEVSTYLEESLDQVSASQQKNKMLHLCSSDSE